MTPQTPPNTKLEARKGQILVISYQRAYQDLSGEEDDSMEGVVTPYI